MPGIKRRTCPSLPSRGRHDQPRAVTNDASLAATAARTAITRSVPLRDRVMFDRAAAPTGAVMARRRPRSVTSPCVCPSVRVHLDLERKVALAQQKKTGPSLQSEGPVRSEKPEKGASRRHQPFGRERAKGATRSVRWAEQQGLTLETGRLHSFLSPCTFVVRPSAWSITSCRIRPTPATR